MTCEALSTTKRTLRRSSASSARFKSLGSRAAIRTDNGIPFSSAKALYRLEQAVRLVAPARHPHRRIRAGHPEQNGRHERMHLTLKNEATGRRRPMSCSSRPASTPSSTSTTTSGRTRRSVWRPRPAVSRRSPACYHGLEELEYPAPRLDGRDHDCGRICYEGRKVNLSQVFAGQKVGVAQVGEHIWLVTFMDYDLGISTTRRAGWNRSKIRSARKCYYVSG